MNGNELAAIVRDLRESVRQRWNRSLPMGDYFVNRSEKALWLGWGEGASVYDSCLVFGDVKVGKQTWVGPFTVLDGSGGGLSIGDYCSISAGVQIYTHDTVAWAISGGNVEPQRAPTRIGSQCYIGPNTIVTKGVTIGDRCIIGANSLVNRDIPGGMKAWGTPCRVMGPIDEDANRPNIQEGDIA